MKLSLGLTLCLILLGGLLISACDPDDTKIDVDCSVHALMSAINTANATPAVTTTLHLSPACVYELSDAVIYDTDLYPAGVGLPAIISPIIVDGQAATIQRSSDAGTAEFRIFLINPGASLTLNQVILRNGSVQESHGYGGAILNYGTLSITNGLILESKAYRGGAVYSTGEFNSLDSLFANNQATFMGGAIHNSGTLSVDQGAFEGNSAYYGGAIGNHTGTGGVGNSTFRNNIAQSGDTMGFGGGVSNTSVSAAQADKGSFVVDVCTLSDNHAGQGGAIANFNYSDFMVRESNLTGNTAQYGGAILNQDEMQIIRSTLANNSAEFYGGGVFYQDNDDPMGLAIGNSTLSGNQISGGNADGGSAFYHLNGNVMIRHATITNNSGAAAWVEAGGDTVAVNNIVANNPGGDCGGPAIGAVSVDGHANLDSDGSCPDFTLTADPMLDPLAVNGGPTITHALQNHSPALDTATTIVGYTTDQRTEIRPHGPASDLGSFESQEYVAGPILQITLITPPPLLELIPTLDVKQMEPDYYWWLFEGFVCSDMELTEFYIRTTSAKETFKLIANDQPVLCYQQSYDKERYWCYVEKQPLGWDTAVNVQFCVGETCNKISRKTLPESKCQEAEAQPEPEKIACTTFINKDNCSAAPGCIWYCSGGLVSVELCKCKDTTTP